MASQEPVDKGDLPEPHRQWAAPAGRSVSRVIEPGGDGQPPSAALPVVDCAVYVGGVRVAGRCTPAEAYALAEKSEDGFVWLGLHEPSAEHMTAVAAVFALDDLVTEHALARDTRPTIDRFGAVTFCALRTARYVDHRELTETSEVVETGAVMILIGPGFVVTVRHGAPGALGPLRAELEDRPELLARGPWAVAYAICDRLVDTYLDVSNGVEMDLDALEEGAFAPHAGGRIAHIYQLKRELVEFKRAVSPLQRPMAAMIEDRDLVPKEIRRYFRDVADHLTRVVERLAAYDDLLNSILQARLAQVTVDQNNDLRKIAAWAAIAATQTAIAGIYGMNFTHLPELQMRYGYPGVLVVMLAAALTLYRMFRRSGWL